jgi:outer membrane protein assembly factor BamB
MKTLWLALTLCVGLQPLVAAEASADWTYSRGNPEMTGSVAADIKYPLDLAWQYKSMAAPRGQAEMLVTSAVVRQGKVYAGNKEGTFFCLELATGKELWVNKITHERLVGGKKVIEKTAFDGAAGFSGDLVICGNLDGWVYAWNAQTGKEQWKYETMGEIHAAVNVWTDPKDKKDYVFVGSHDNNIYCLTAADGKKVWEAETGNYVNGGAAVGEGKVVFGGCDAVLHVHDALSGKELRQVDVGNYIGNNVAISAGIIYVTHYGGRVGAYDMSTGTKVWEYGERDFEYYAAVGIAEKIIVAAGRDKRIHGIDRATGKGLWEMRTKDTIDSSPLVCGGKTVLCGSTDGYIYALNLKDGAELWHYEIGAAVRTSAAVAGDYVLFGADDGTLYCFKPGVGAQ